MRRAMLIAAGFAALSVIASAGPAVAGYGALARDDATGKYGLSWNETTSGKAEELALKDCGGAKSCKIVFRTGSRQCGAIATPEKGKAWGAATRDRKDATELAAITDCQKHTTDQCKVRASGCNK